MRSRNIGGAGWRRGVGSGLGLVVRRGGGVGGGGEFFSDVVAALGPVRPTGFPVVTGVLLSGFGPEEVEGLEVGGGAGVVPFGFGFDEVEMVLGIVGCEEEGLLEMLTGFFAVADAGGPAGAIAIEEAEVAVGAGVVEGGVVGEDEGKFGLHFTDNLEGTEGLGLGEFAEVEAEVVVGFDGGRVGGYELAGGGDTLAGDAGAAFVGGLDVGEIKGGPGELPESYGVVGVGLEAGFGGEKGFFGALDEYGVGGIAGTKDGVAQAEKDREESEQYRGN